MTVASNTPYNQYSATAGQTVFNYTFEIVEQTDILVYQRGENDDPNDTADLLVLNVDYTVAGVGNENGGTITLTSGATLNDVITLKQNVPVERDSSFTNGGVLRAQDLNNEFDAQMLTQQVSRFNEENRMLRYWDSAILTDPKDLIIPVLSANQIWAMNDDGDEIIPYNVPSGGGIAPSDATYLLQTAHADLPNAQAMGALASGLVVNTTTTGVQLTRTITGTTNEIDISNGSGISGNPTVGIADNAVIPGTAGMGIPAGTTAQRVTPIPPSIGLRWNTDIKSLEFYDATLADWIQLEDSGDIANLIARLAANTVGDGASMIGLQDQGTVSNQTVQDLANLDFVCLTDPTATAVNGVVLGDHALLLSGGTMGGTIDMDSNTIINLPLPTIASEPATKGYVDGIAFNTHPACNYSTTADLAGYTYDNGTLGEGATLTAGSNGAFSADGQSPALNDRIFVPFQTNQAHNGIYVLTQVGDGSNPAILTRATDFDTSSDMQAGDEVAVIAGDTLAGSKWMMTQTSTIVVGTTDITWLNITSPLNVVTLDGAQTITGVKTFNANVILGNSATLDLNGTTAIDGFIDDDTFATASDTTGATSESIKAYVDNTFGSRGFSKNIIIGGDFSVNPWQRGTTFAAIASDSYSADRWKVNYVTSAVVTINKEADAPTAAESGLFSQDSLKIEVTTADASIAASDIFYLNQRIEGYNITPIAGQIFTLSFWVKASKTGTYCVAFLNTGVDRSYVSEYTVDVANTWEYKTVTVAASPTAGTWNFKNGEGLNVAFVLAAGTNFQTATPDTWQTAGHFATANQVNALDTIGNTFQIDLVQLEKGDMATGFEVRQIQDELMLCQRYFWKTFQQGVTPAHSVGFVGAISYRAAFTGVGNQGDFNSYPVPMRTTPTLTSYSPSAASSNWYNASAPAASGSLSTVSASDRGFFANNVQVAGDNQGSSIGIHVTADAEL